MTSALDVEANRQMKMFRKFTAKVGMTGKTLTVVLLAFCVTFLITGFIVYNQFEEEIIASTTRENQNLSHGLATQAKDSLNEMMTVARSLAQTMEVNIRGSHSLSRDDVIRMLRHIMDSNSNIIGVYVGFEPNVFDGRDNEFKNAEGHDATGRFIPYLNKLKGSLTFDRLLDYDKEGEGDYYLLPKRTGKESLLEPYFYDGVLMTSLIVPIKDGQGRFVGIAGVDISLTSLDSMISKIKTLETGTASLVSNRGAFLSSPDKIMLGYSTLENINIKAIRQAFTSGTGLSVKDASEDDIHKVAKMEAANTPEIRSTYKKLAAEVRAGNAGMMNLVNRDTGQLQWTFYEPVSVGKTDTPWSLLVSVPLSEALTPLRAIVRNLVLVAVGALVLITFLVVGAVRRITRPIGMTVRMLQDIAQGEADLSKRILVTSNDEAGELASSFNAYVEKLSEQSWLKTKVAEIADFYPITKDLETLANNFITTLTPMVEANYGVFYIKEGQAERQYFKKLATYAYNAQEIGTEGFRFGEGLIGQCAIENKIILLNQVPENYIKITSALGMASPKSIIMLPVEFDGQVLAVIELASLGNFSPLHQALLQQVLSNLGINANKIINHMEVERLLKESQALTEELQIQAEELQTQAEELQTQQEELQTQQEDLMSINEKLEEQFANSEQKARELEKTKQKLEEKTRQLILSSKYKSEFLANMSHELRTPLNSLLILSQILAENTYGNLSVKQVEYANTIYSSGNDLLNLINEILDLSKIESGKKDINSSDVFLSDICDFIKSQFSPVASKKGIKFKVRLDDNLPTTIFTDEHRLLQILKNLLSNAFKYTEEGSVTLHIHKADQKVLDGRQGLKSAEPEIAFSIVDTGIGIPEEKQSSIFEAFQQADGTTNRKYGGTGLGLTISREIAHLLCGFIEVKSKEEQGSTFTLYLEKPEDGDHTAQTEVAAGLFVEPSSLTVDPVEDTVAADKMDDQSIKHGEALLKGKKILIVDDDMRNVFALTTALERHKLEVLYAENGREGIKVLRKNPDIDLVLMDIMMPEMDGFEAMRAIRLMNKYQTLPIIALTAKAMKNDREQCIAAGASDYISKPINLDQLFSLMRVWLYK